MSPWYWAFLIVMGFSVLVGGCELWLRHLDRRRQAEDERRRQALEFAAHQPADRRRVNGRLSR